MQAQATRQSTTALSRIQRTFGVLRQILALVWAEATGYVRLRLALALLLVVTISVGTALAPVALKLLVDYFTSGHAQVTAYVLLLTGGYVLGQWLTRVLGELRGYVDAQADRRMYRSLSQRLFGHVLDLPLRYHLERRTGALNETLANGLLGYQIVLQQTVYTMVPVAVELVTVAVILASLDQSVFLIVFFVALFGYVGVFWYGMSQISEAARDASMAQIDERAVMTDSILNYETVKYFTAEALVKQRFDMALARTETHWLRFFRSKTLNGVLIATIFALFLALTTSYAVYQVVRGSMTIGVFVLVNSYIFQLVRPVEALGFAVQGLAQGIAFLERLLELLQVEPEPRSGKWSKPLDGAGMLEFERVGVGYRSERPVLREVSFTLPAGKTLGIVGASGAGKSTLVRLLVRLLEPDSGRIFLDGAPIDMLDLQRLRAAIAVVPQDTVLFNDSIRYNIAFGRPDSAQVDIEAAAKIARLHDFIMTLPERYDTSVGERGLKLSGGEKQRVSIARAALKHPRIYVFDEATSSLDSRTESEILANLREISQFSTTLIIAHRLSSVVHADQIVVIDGGTIVERGTHAGLLQIDGKYAALWRAQQRTGKTDPAQIDQAPVG